MKWLLGGIGFVLGLAASRFENALSLLILGFMAGGFIDFLRNRKSEAPRSELIPPDLKRIDAALEDIHWRLKRLEDARGLAASPLEAQAAGAAPDGAAAPAAQDVPAPEAVVATEPPANQPSAASPAGTPTPAPSGEWLDTMPMAPYEPPRPKGPSPLGVALSWFTGGNTVVKVGIVILFFGVAFLIKYAADHALLPIELRLGAVAAFAVALLVLGWRVAEKHRHAPADDDDAEVTALSRIRRGYGLLLQGAAAGLLYLTLFGAFRLYNLLPGPFAFGLMCAVVVLTAILAIRQDALALAAFGSAGGFLAPILASTGGGSHVGLFSFYLLLNAGIFGIAWFKSWRVLNLLGFVFTFGIAAVWGVNAYRPEQFASTEPFLIAFFLLYVAIALAFALREAPRLTSYVDGTLVFGTPIVAFSMQAGLVRDMPFGAAFSAVAVSAFYLLLAAALRTRAGLRLLFESFVALGVVFATLAVPLALDGRWTSAVWALEGAAVVWAGLRQRRILARAFGYLVMLGAGVAFMLDDAHWRVDGEWPVLNAACVGRVLIALAALYVARLIDRADDSRVGEGERVLARVWAAWGGAWWLVAGLAELDRWLTTAQAFNAGAVFVAASAGAAALLARRLAWRRLDYALVALLPLLILAAGGILVERGHPFAAYGYVAWPLALAVHVLLLYRHERRQDEDAVRIPGLYHALGIWLVTLLAVAELHHLTTREALSASVWSASAAAVPLVAMVLWLSSARAFHMWPVAWHARECLKTGLTPLIVLGWAWIFYADWRYDGQAGPLAYVPLFNALDLTHLFVVAAFVAWWRALKRAELEPPLTNEWLYAALGAAVFFWLNAVLLRTIHQWGGVPYRFDALMRSTLVQASLSLFWTVLALVLMWVANRRGLRALWMTGAFLMGATVVKLFVIDLSNIGGIERIVSFIGVGLLMLGVGYFSPLPPKRAAAGDAP